MVVVVARVLAFGCVWAALAGCGAKTGLLVPERDAEPDAEIDAGTPKIPCYTLDFEQGDLTADLSTDAELAVADIYFLVDVTGSMSQEIDNIQRRLRDRIVPGIAAEIPDVGIGVGYFADFPYGDFGLDDDVPFEQLHTITHDLIQAQAAVDRLPLLDGNDGPEGQVEALYQVATAEGFGGDLSDPLDEHLIEPGVGCPTGGSGYPCFRDDALPIVLMFTDAPFHNGPTGMYPYSGIPDGPAHTWQQAVDALSELGVSFIGLDSAGFTDLGGVEDMRETGRALGTIDVDGNPLVFDIGDDGGGLDDTVVDAVKTLADRVRFDVDAIVEDVPGDPIDARTLIESIRPLAADPANGFESMSDTAFFGVIPGTRVTFSVTLRNDVIPRGPEPQFVRVRIVFRGNFRSTLKVLEVDLVIPAEDGEGCPPEQGSGS